MLAGSVFLAFVCHYSIYFNHIKSPKLPGENKTVLSITTETLEKRVWSRDGRQATLKARVKSGPHKGKSVTIDFSADENGKLIWDHPVTDKQLGNTTEEVLRTLIRE